MQHRGEHFHRPYIGLNVGGKMRRLAIIDDYEGLALKMGNWESLFPGVQADAFSDHLVGEEALVKRLLPL